MKKLVQILDRDRRSYALPKGFNQFILQKLPIKRTTRKLLKVLQSNTFNNFLGFGLSAKRYKLCRTYAKERAVGAIHELPLRQNEAFRAFLRKSYYIVADKSCV
jgi:hypothetical protein